MEDSVKQTLTRQLRRLATERPYQVVAASAAALALATGTGAVLVGTDDAPTTAHTTTAVAEMRGDTVASRADTRAEPTPSTPPGSAAPSSAAPSPSPSPTPKATSAAPSPVAVSEKTAPKPPTRKVLDYDFQAQTTGYYCGPAAVRNALSAAGVDRDQDTLAAQLGTTYAGTNSALDTTRVLNATLKGEPYSTTMLRGGSATPTQMDQLQADVVEAITDGRGVVVNVAGSATDTDGGWHSFPGGHYVAVVGYADDGRLVKIADSADASYYSYWMSTTDLAHWAATRGYSS
ncbi:C39 family peptidase [Verrucosispora sp. NA02020]|uniref:C39 family peptidase n=1 Tax=Verrucosispora sp. NA02020 TaxID=2742132 RepID=UPI001590E9D0|nr:C39 family peptidase [Verrucosispora sp. NA02020]QKW13075.1 C39 family peptidase [Verrucosispora sp. NA02020]